MGETAENAIGGGFQQKSHLDRFSWFGYFPFLSSQSLR